ncbi:hypothetical protein R3W88_025917 [Solanum pinnatisectum]|uniref:protein O-GlcNAc transferase n=1 Tax=Solanum pinnatisectum TaxID=50273 RepID=A0AAV9M6U8_9SOLN|nr:hypothetical protein R3W88_025917 [Solanum pinnatisectum]
MAFVLLGLVYYEQGNLEMAIRNYRRAIARDAECFEAYSNLGNALRDAGRVQEAIHCYDHCISFQPDHPQILSNLGNTYMERNMMSGDAQCYNLNLAVTTGISVPFTNLAVLYMQQGNYRLAISCCNEVLRINPMATDGLVNRGITYVESGKVNEAMQDYTRAIAISPTRADAHELLASAYMMSPNDGTEWGIHIQYEAEHFIDVSSLTFDLTARMINEDQIQILIDLNGYTKGGRSEIFAMQPAPIQVSYMGFPGTTGATYIDYMITDEKLVHLPHCYFVNDYKQKNRNVLYPNSQPKWSDYGLPEDKFIFACFNQLNKMDPEIFTTWGEEALRISLVTDAAAQGLQQNQIIFTDVAMKQEHIKRCSLVDLSLDTPLYNAHTTGTDVPWAGLPMITLPLEKMATRVAGSLCLATGLGDEMIVSSMKEYQEKAVSLALNRPKLKNLTNRHKAVRMSCPLFDTAHWVRNLERSYFKMWNLYCSGQHPQHFKVTENDSEFPFDR